MNAFIVVGLILFVVGVLWGTLNFLLENTGLCIVLLLLGIAPGLIGGLLYGFKSRGPTTCMGIGMLIMFGTAFLAPH